MTWPEFLLMGGYAPYVWGSYAVTLAAMGWEVLIILRRRRMLQSVVGSRGRSQQERARR